MARVVIGLSGGVDSSVAAYLLKQQGHDVIGLFMINWHDTTGTLEGDCPWHDDRVFAELVAKRLDIPLRVVDLSQQYRQRVVDYMFAEYERGRTPNPDVLCNREIKFDAFLNEALKLGADFVATGHYCRKAEETVDGKTIYKLLAGADKNKDQSYFLCQLSQEQLRYAMFPVGDIDKPEVRRIAEEQHLATAKRKDSQGICFVGKVDLPVFLQQKLAARKGNIHEILPTWPKYAQRHGDDLATLAEPWHYTVRDGKKIGEHNGAHFYTIGQRKGLGIGGRKESLFIIATDVRENVIYVGEGDYHPGLYRRALKIQPDEVHWVNPARRLETGESGRFAVRIRYRQPLQQATLHMREDAAYILFDEPQRGIAAGQFAAWYDGDELVGSGVIYE
ncbi:MAG TPA: tRNA 2-thiouridine(34) synthase MnmA [Candidatus Alistipes excrementipullorum]|nr:tRNA 2-thiouridine(34) synthase MnmA [Candidatus Alistipes excrementipullorum]